jgi:L-fuconolactonase
MVIVDTHCHASPVWYEPVEGLLFQMDRNGVDKALLVQIKGQADNEYQFECVGRYPDRLASIVVVDTARPDAADELERLVERGARGVRLWTDTRSAGDDPYLVWRKAEALGLPITCGGTAAEFAADGFAELVQAVPNASIVVEHLGSVSTPDGEGAPYETRRKVFELARFPNVYLKIHGLGEFSPRAMPVKQPLPFAEPIPPLLDLAYEAFGPSRMMWGSDFPPVSGREGYANALGFPMEQLADKPEADRALVFGGTAVVVYGLGD